MAGKFSTPQPDNKLLVSKIQQKLRVTYFVIEIRRVKKKLIQHSLQGLIFFSDRELR